MNYDQFDRITQNKLSALKEILEYVPNNPKILAFHKSTAKTRLLLGGKRCLPLDYEVLNAIGEWVKIDSLEVGDEVLGVDLRHFIATPTTIIAKHYSGKKLIYRIEFTDGTSCRASLDHEFPIYSINESGISVARYTVEHVKQLFDEAKFDNSGFLRVEQLLLLTKTGLQKFIFSDERQLRVKTIVPLNEQETVDITVAHPDHTFVGESGVITGNSGKSYAAAVETVWAGLGIHPYGLYPDPPLNIRYCSVDFINGIKGIILPMFKRFLGPFDDGPVCKKYWVEDRILELKNGTVIQFNSYDQELSKFEGVSRNLCVMDEEPPLDVYQSNFLRTIDCGGKLIIACTPIHGLTWLYFDLYNNPNAVPPAVESWHIKTSENPHISQDEIEAVKRDPAMRDHLEVALEGEFVPKSNLVFKHFSDANILEGFQLTNDHMILVGIDPHDRNPWGVVFVALNRENEYIVYDEILEAGVVDEIAPLIKNKLGARRANVIVIDTSANAVQATSGKSIKDQLLQSYGLYCTDADKDVQAGILTVNSLLRPPEGGRPKLYITPNCVNLKRQFRNTIWEDWTRNRNQRDPKERVLKRDDHLVDALRYVVMVPIRYRHPGYRYQHKQPDRISRVTGYF